jgi:hypothetical protein
MKRPTMKQVIYKALNNNSGLNIFGSIRLSLVTHELQEAGFKRIPEGYSLAKLCKEVFDHEVVGGLRFFDYDFKKRRWDR